jgi:hypothetical protein
MLFTLGVLFGFSHAHGANLPPVQFNRDVRPILAENCFQCHGPDQAQRQADLRLDREADALAERESGRAVVPGQPEKSEVIRRTLSSDPDVRMPPPSSGRWLTEQQHATLRRWIEEGARWESHWSLTPPVSPSLPVVSDENWVKNPIDRFILARLDREGLHPASQATKAALIRRVTLDLTGLPSAPAEVAAFLADDAPDAYERVVDRLLASPRYGERMAVRWLDAARYADTNGYQSDGERFMWRWRDWVIDAYNSSVPFDRFTIEQLAGDLLPNATLEQRIATGFNRNHRGNGEGGIIPEEYAVEYVVDRVETTATVWMGLTLGCCRCHDHKYDPFTQRDFYQLFAFFNQVPERGRANKFGNSSPVIRAPTTHEQRQLNDVDLKLDAALRQWDALGSDIRAAQSVWEAEQGRQLDSDWSIDRGLALHLPLDGSPEERDLPDTALPAENAHHPASAAREPMIDVRQRTPAEPAHDGPLWCEGVIGSAARFDGARRVSAFDRGHIGFFDPFSLGAWVRLDPGGGGTVAGKMAETDGADGYNLAIVDGALQLNLVKRWLDDALRVAADAVIPSGEWHHLLVTYDGSRVAEGVRFYIDGRLVPTVVLLDELNQPFDNKEPFTVGCGGFQSRFRGSVDDVRLYSVPLDSDEAAVLAVRESVAGLCARSPGNRIPSEEAKLRMAFLDRYGPDEVRRAWHELETLRRRKEALVASFPTVMVMEDSSQPRATHILLRGQYDRPGERVEAAVPAALPPMSPGLPANRLGLALWLTSPEHPLTARVAVNRAWQQHFGLGLVKTSEDFGSQGEWPLHQELLDYLAVEFVRCGWDEKALHRLIVTSAAYSQSAASAESWRLDPDNRLFARGPRIRLSAEMIRDQALAAAGLLVSPIGGPSVKPYQPPGLWIDLTGSIDYVQDHGEFLYRRGLYTFWKRTVAPPSMAVFDAAGRETCTVRETRTNTALQALALLNDVTFVEAARGIARRAMHEGPTGPEDWLRHAFLLVTARQPDADELATLTAGWRSHFESFRADPDRARALLSIGETPVDESLDPCAAAATLTMASLILNLDEAVNRP